LMKIPVHGILYISLLCISYSPCVLYHPFLDPNGVSLMDDFSLHVTYS